MRGPIYAPVPGSETPTSRRQRREQQRKALRRRRLLVALPILTLLLTSLLFFALSMEGESVARLEVPTVASGPKAPTAGSQKGSNPDSGVAAKDLTRVKAELDRKSTRLNSSHLVISYAVFCLK